MEVQFIRSDWFSVHIPGWTRHLAHLKGVPGVRGVEVGSFEGRSACWLLQNILTHETSHLTCIDVFKVREDLTEIVDRMKLDVPRDLDMEGRFDRNIQATGASNRVTKLKGESYVMLRALPLLSFDLAYIDGSHTSMDVLRDGMLCWDLLKPGGLLIFDDYRWSCFPEEPLKNPGIAVDAFLLCMKGHYELVEKHAQVIVRKKELLQYA